MAFRRVPWTSKPPINTPIDWSNPITRLLKRFVVFDEGGVAYDAVQKQRGVPQANYAGTVNTIYGTAMNCVDATGTQVPEFTGEWGVISDYATSGLTAMFLARSNKAGARTNQEFLGGAETAGTNDIWNSRVLVGGSPNFTLYVAGSPVGSNGTYPTGKDSQDWLYYGGTYDPASNESICKVSSTPYDMAVDATPATPGTLETGDSSTYYSIGSLGSSSNSWDGEIVFGAEWLRPLTDEEWNSMVENPWQVFEPRLEPLYTEVPPGIRQVGTVATHQSTTVDGDYTLDVTVPEGTTLLLVSAGFWGAATAAISDWTTTTEPFTVISAEEGGLGGDCGFKVWGIVNPSAKTNTITITVTGDTNYHWGNAVCFTGTKTSSVLEAVVELELDNNALAETNTLTFSEAGVPDDHALVLSAAALGDDMVPASIAANPPVPKLVNYRKVAHFYAYSPGQVVIPHQLDIQAGDFLVVTVNSSHSSLPSFSDANGDFPFDELVDRDTNVTTGDSNTYIGQRVAGSNEPDTYVWDIANSPATTSLYTAYIFQFRGVNVNDPWDTSPANASWNEYSATSAPVASSITTGTNNCLVICMALGDCSEDTNTMSGGQTQDPFTGEQMFAPSTDHRHPNNEHFYSSSFYMFPQATAGATGDKTFTVGANDWASTQFALKPAPITFTTLASQNTGGADPGNGDGCGLLAWTPAGRAAPVVTWAQTDENVGALLQLVPDNNRIYVVDGKGDGAAVGGTGISTTHGMKFAVGDVVFFQFGQNTATGAVHSDNNTGYDFVKLFEEDHPAPSPNSHVSYWYRRIDGTEGSTFTFSSTITGDEIEYTYLQLRNVDPSTPFDVLPSAVTRNWWGDSIDSTLELRPQTAMRDGSLSISTMHGDQGGTGYFSFGDNRGQYVGRVNSNRSGMVGFSPNPKKGYIETFKGTNEPSNPDWVGHHLIVNPAQTGEIEYVGSANNGSTGQSNVSITHGIDIQENDVIFALYVVNASTGQTLSGDGTYTFTKEIEDNHQEAGQDSRIGIFTRIATASEPASYTFSCTGGPNDQRIALYVLRNVDIANIWDVTPTTTAATRTSGLAATETTSASIRVTNPDSWTLGFCAVDDNTVSISGGTERNFTNLEAGSGSQAVAIASRREYDKTNVTPRFVAGATTSQATGLSMSITHGLPIQKDDVLIAVVHWNSVNSTTSLYNWFKTEFDEENPSVDNSRISIFSRVCTGLEPDTFTFENITTADAAVLIAQFRGVDIRDIWDVPPSASTRVTEAGVTTFASPQALTTEALDTIGLGLFFNDNATTFSSYTNSYGDEVEPGAEQGISLVSKVYSTAGSQGTVNATSSLAGNLVMHHIALKGAPAQYGPKFTLSASSDYQQYLGAVNALNTPPITLVGAASTGVLNSGATSGSITHGISIQANDFIVALVHVNSASNTINDNNGSTPFTERVADRNHAGATSTYAIFERVAGGSEPATYNFNGWSTPGEWSISLLVFRGVDINDPWNVPPTVDHEVSIGSVTSAVVPSITTTVPNTRVILFAGSDSDPYTWGSVDNEFVEETFDDVGRPTCLYSKYLPDAEVVGDTTLSWVGSNDIFGLMGALQPAVQQGITITVVDTDNIWDDGDTGLIASGTGFL